MKNGTLCLVASLGVFANLLSAQNQPSGYHSVACIKIQPGKNAEYRQFVSDYTRKMMQANVEGGDIAVWYLLRTVIPAGLEARCDYVSVAVYKGRPPAPSGMESLTKQLQKAGLSATADEFLAKRGALTRLVSYELWRTAIHIGEIEKGDYAYVNFMKVHSMKDWMDLEENMWKPMAETWVKDGSMHAWGVNLPVLPSGTELKYQGISLDVFPSWDAALQSRPLSDTFKKVHAGKDLNETFEKLGKSRDLARRELLVVEEKIASNMKVTRR